MGSVSSRCYGRERTTNELLRAKIQLLEEEIDQVKRSRQYEAWDYEERLAAFAAKEEEWRRHEEEAARLRKAVKADVHRRRCLEKESAAAEAGCGEDPVKRWRCLGASGYLVECMKDEQARREETVEKWKQLYLTIKTELDDLIRRTREGERFGWVSEENVMIEQLQTELREMEKSMEALRSHIAVLQKEAAKKDREIDILRQCLRILSSKKRGFSTNYFTKSLRS
ncbi:golgin subfamily A member 6-like protein 22 [Canna indica]|uniref:Golgin subfamily A member 6-like protein 22 n=1 Tax=Canna indica TaxID=4628 RepID=A0AAQ3L2C1_9LILI|nr:golgin subfamily A member 6-like protein 22 [Canna indica]